MVHDDEGAGGRTSRLSNSKKLPQETRLSVPSHGHKALVIYKPHLIESHSNVSSFRMQFDLKLRRDIYDYYRFLC